MTRDALLAAIYAAPADDEPRRVYADWLLERGDPRGEFIQLQLSRMKTAEQHKRERALFVVHSDRWLDELEASPAGAVFERGFVAIAAPRDGVLSASPGWATVHTLLAATPRDDVAMPALHTLRGLREADVAALAELRRPLTATELVWVRGPGNQQNPFPPFEAITALPELRRLAVQRGTLGHEELPQTAAWLLNVRWGKLDELVISTQLRTMRLWIELAQPSRLKTIELRASTEIDEWDDHWRCVLSRDAHGRFAHLDVHGWLKPYRYAARRYGSELVQAVRNLAPNTLGRVRIVLPKRQAGFEAQIATALATQVEPTIELV